MANTMGEFITLENFATVMSPFEKNADNHLYALVDMGSNGIRFSISDLSPPNSRLLKCVYRERAGISLYDALHESAADSKPGYFSKHTIKEVADTLGRFKDICNAYGVLGHRVGVFATEAMRTAKNKEEMLEAIHKESGLKVDIMDPKMESMFGAMGARSGFDDVDGLFMDLGGGSVQMTYMQSGRHDYHILAAEAAKSMPFGAAKLTLALSSQDTAQTATEELRSSMRETIQGLAGRFPTLKHQLESDEGVTIFFCGGGFRGYGSMLMHTDPIQPYPVTAIGGYIASGTRFSNWREMLHANNFEKGKIYGMSKRRREQFPAIVTVVQALVEAIPKHSKIKQVIFCSGGNREGVLYMKLTPEERESRLYAMYPPAAPDKSPGVMSEEFKYLTLGHHLWTARPKDTTILGFNFTSDLFSYIGRSIWYGMGSADDANSAKALYDPISGSLADLPGLTHPTRSILALILCARWGTDLGPTDKSLLERLRALVGPELSWWCDYFGILARFIAVIMPGYPSTTNDSDALKEVATFSASTGAGLGKKGHKVGVRLKIKLAEKVRRGLHIGDLENMFSKVGKGIKLDWKVEAEILDEL